MKNRLRGDLVAQLWLAVVLGSAVLAIVLASALRHLHA